MRTLRIILITAIVTGAGLLWFQAQQAPSVPAPRPRPPQFGVDMWYTGLVILGWAFVGLFVIACTAAAFRLLAWGIGSLRDLRYIYPVNGLYPVVERNTAAPWERLLGVFRATYIPTALLVAPGTVAVKHGETTIAGGQSGWSQQEHLQATLAEMRVRTVAAMAGASGDGRPAPLNAAKGKLISGYWDRPGRTITADKQPDILPAADVPQLTVADTLEMSDANRWLVGQNQQTGIQAYFEPDVHHHAAMVGAAGTGKTTMAEHMIFHALRSGFHPIILDPKRGIDFKPFADHVEWHPTDGDRFPRQLDAVIGMARERMRFLERTGATNWFEAREQGITDEPHVIVVIEEFGVLSTELDPATVADLKLIAQLLRAAGAHLLLLDNAADWPHVILGAVKFPAVFRCDPRTAGRMQAYNAGLLKPRGQFIYQRNIYDTWNVAPEMQKLLATVPSSPWPQVVDGDVTKRSFVVGDPGVRRSEPAGEGGVQETNGPERTSERTNEQSDESAGSRWQPLIDAWFADHPEALTGPAQGISDIARRMAVADTGTPDNYQNYKGIAHELYHQYRAAHAPQRRRKGDGIIDLGTDDGQRWLAENWQDIHWPTGDR